MNPTLARLWMKLFPRECVSWDGERFTITFPGYAHVPQIQQRAVIPLCFEALMENLGSEGKAQWHNNRIRIKPEKPLTKEAQDKFALGANNLCRAFLTRDFWMGVLFGAIAERNLEGDDEEE